MWRRILDLADDFPLGRVPLLLLILAALSGGAVLLRAASAERADLTIWTFAHINYAEMRARAAQLPNADRIHMLNLGRAATDRLALAVMTQTDLPDLVEVEQSEIGRYFRGPLETVPFVDLTERIDREGWRQRCIGARFLKYSTRGRIFGLPRDLHPMVMVYRPDVLAEAGLRVEQMPLWSDWVAAADKLYRPGARGSTEWRYGLALSTVEAADFLVLLWQRGGDVFDAAENVTIDSDLAVETLEQYMALLAGSPPLAGPKLSGWYEDFGALARGQFAALIVPDWLLATMQTDARSLLEGKLRCRPLPAWEPGGRRTSTLGGTMLGIPKGGRDVEAAWQTAKALYFDPAALLERFRKYTILPPLREIYGDPVFDEPVAFFGGQPVGRLLTEMADEVPPVHGAAYTPLATALLDAVFADVTSGRTTPRAALTDVARQLREQLARDRLTGAAEARQGAGPAEGRK